MGVSVRVWVCGCVRMMMKIARRWRSTYKGNIRTNVCAWVCLSVWLCVCGWVCMWGCVCVLVVLFILTAVTAAQVDAMRVFVSVRVYVSEWVCMCVCPG